MGRRLEIPEDLPQVQRNSEDIHMRLDKFTTKFQEALSDAQSIALGNDHAYIEPVHMLVAMLKQDDGPKALLQRAGANVPGLLAAAEAAVKRLPQVQGNDQVQGGPELGRVLQATEKEAIKRGDKKRDGAGAEGRGGALPKYCWALPGRARRGKLDPVIGRDDEIRRAI